MAALSIQAEVYMCNLCLELALAAQFFPLVIKIKFDITLKWETKAQPGRDLPLLYPSDMVLRVFKNSSQLHNYVI